MPVSYPNRLFFGYETGTPGSSEGVSVLRCMSLCVCVVCVLAILMCMGKGGLGASLTLNIVVSAAIDTIRADDLVFPSLLIKRQNERETCHERSRSLDSCASRCVRVCLFSIMRPYVCACLPRRLLFRTATATEDTYLCPALDGSQMVRRGMGQQVWVFVGCVAQVVPARCDMCSCGKCMCVQKSQRHQQAMRSGTQGLAVHII